MLRFTFIFGYAFFLLGMIAIIGLKIIALGKNGSFGDSPMLGFSRRLDAFLFSPSHLPWFFASIIGLIVIWVLALRHISKTSPEWEKAWVKTLSVGSGIMMAFFLILAVVGLTANYTTGLVQETASKIAGFLSSPVIMETSFFFIGAFLLLGYNSYRRRADGDDFVEMEIKDED